MLHELFGRMRFKEADESWAGWVPLARFAAVGLLPDPQPLTEEDAARMTAEMTAAMDALKAQMRERFGDRIDAALAEVENTPEDAPGDPDSRDEVREAKRRERRAKRAARLAEGRFPVRVAGPGGTDPTPNQEAAFRFLQQNEQLVYDAVLAEVWAAFQNAYGQEHWRQITGMRPAATPAELAGRFAVTRLDITRESRGGFAHLAFLIESDWQDEHGLLVVYSPDTQAASWTTWDGLYDLLESDDPAEEPEEYAPTPHDLLLEAILTNDEARAKELVAEGADINALGPDEYPPLWIAVDQMEVEEVRRLLAAGADPALANPDERTTPLKHAKRMYRDMGFAPSKKRDELLEGVLSMMRDAAGDKFHDIKLRLEEIIALLEGTGK